MLIWSEDLVRFKILADRLMTTCATLKEIEEFLAWVHRFRDTRIFVHAKFDKCFERIKELVASGKTWVHFDISWKMNIYWNTTTSLEETLFTVLNNQRHTNNKGKRGRYG